MQRGRRRLEVAVCSRFYWGNNQDRNLGGVELILEHGGCCGSGEQSAGGGDLRAGRRGAEEGDCCTISELNV